MVVKQISGGKCRRSLHMRREANVLSGRHLAARCAVKRAHVPRKTHGERNFHVMCFIRPPRRAQVHEAFKCAA
eukprot:8016712-Pyramimonas_sp.AAC.1